MSLISGLEDLNYELKLHVTSKCKQASIHCQSKNITTCTLCGNGMISMKSCKMHHLHIIANFSAILCDFKHVVCCYRYTQNEAKKTVYAIALKWPTNYQLILGAVKTTSATAATLLGHGILSWKQDAGSIAVDMPHLPLDSPLTWAWAIEFTALSN